MKRKKNTTNKQNDKNYFQNMDESEYDNYFSYVITREEIEACDIQRLLHALTPKFHNPFFRSGPCSVFFSVSGYEDDSRNLTVIPEFRAFVRKVQQYSPCWLYFAMPINGWLRLILAASTSECRTETIKGKERVVLTKSQVIEFFETQLVEYGKLMQKRGVYFGGVDIHLMETIRNSFPELMAR